MTESAFPSNSDICIIGPAICDVLAGPVSHDPFGRGTQPMEQIRISYGGNGLNEAVILSRLGQPVELISCIGDDETGERVLSFLKRNGVSTKHIVRDRFIPTGVNIVLVDEKGERCFLTNPSGSLRMLSEKHILPQLEQTGKIVCFSGMFISPLLDVPAMERIFKKIRGKPGRILAVDMTSAKHGETIAELRSLLQMVDVIFPNEKELYLLTGKDDPVQGARALVECGAGCAVVKLGARGCILQTRNLTAQIPSWPVARAVDTTGAGDCFAAGFLWAMNNQLPLTDCARFACACASCVVERFGATEGLTSLEEPMRRFHMMKKSEQEG